ncbi:MAG: hypothetical protein AB4372_10370 [Xenococcus sp. (in: cyanobacteria)]
MTRTFYLGPHAEVILQIDVLVILRNNTQFYMAWMMWLTTASLFLAMEVLI